MTNGDERAARLAAQLRANLHRRKAQARGLAAEDRAGGAGDGKAPAPAPSDD